MINNVFPYPGNKARHSEWILEHIPEHECYVELFGGAAGVLFNKPRSKIEVYNDLNGDIPHFFRVLRDRCEELQEWLKNVPYSREIHNKWKDEYYTGERKNDDIERAGRFFTLRYMQFSGKVYGTSGFKSCFSQRNYAGQFQDGVDRLDEFADRLRRVEIDNRDAFEIIDSLDRENVLFYADPPYMDSEYQYDSGGFNHKKLAEVAEQMDGKIMISYDSIPPFYDENFTHDTKSSTCKMDNSGVKDATETLIMNYDSDGEQIMSDVGQQGLGAFE